MSTAASAADAHADAGSQDEVADAGSLDEMADADSHDEVVDADSHDEMADAGSHDEMANAVVEEWTRQEIAVGDVVLPNENVVDWSTEHGFVRSKSSEIDVTDSIEKGHNNAVKSSYNCAASEPIDSEAHSALDQRESDVANDSFNSAKSSEIECDRSAEMEQKDFEHPADAVDQESSSDHEELVSQQGIFDLLTRGSNMGIVNPSGNNEDEMADAVVEEWTREEIAVGDVVISNDHLGDWSAVHSAEYSEEVNNEAHDHTEESGKDVLPSVVTKLNGHTKNVGSDSALCLISNNHSNSESALPVQSTQNINQRDMQISENEADNSLFSNHEVTVNNVIPDLPPNTSLNVAGNQDLVKLKKESVQDIQNGTMHSETNEQREVFEKEQPKAESKSSDDDTIVSDLRKTNGRLKRELDQSLQEIESLESSSNQFRSQLKQTREQLRLLTMETAAEKQAHLEAISREKNALSVLGEAQSQTEQLLAALQTRDAELRDLKISQHELPARVLQLQSDLEEERSRFKSLAERFNRVKDLELHRQRQRFMEVSQRQKEVFDRLKARYAAVRSALEEQQHQCRTLREKDTAGKHRLDVANSEIERLKKRWEDVGQDRDSAERKFEEERKRLSTQLASTQQQLVETTSELSRLREATEAKAREDEAKKAMLMCIECDHEHSPELGDDLFARTSHCGDVVDFSWSRSFAGSQFTGIKGCSHDTYTLTADDIGACIRSRCSNVAGLSTEAETSLVHVSQDVANTLHELLTSKKDVAFSVRPESEDPGAGTGLTTLVLTKDKLKLRHGKRTHVKEEFSKSIQVRLDPLDDLLFRVTFNTSSKPVALFAETSSMRDLIAITIRCFKLLHSTHAVYKEKDSSMAMLQFLITTANAESSKFRANVADPSRKFSHTVSRSFSIARPSVLVVPNQPVAKHHRSKSSQREESVASESVASEVELSSAKMASEVFQERRLDTCPENASANDANHRAMSRSDSVQYDADGYIIRDEINPFGSSSPLPYGFSEDEDSNLPALSREPIVIKPKEEAVEASVEELSKAMIGMARPPPSSSKKSTARAKTEKVKKKKKRKKIAKHTRAKSEMNDEAVVAPPSETPSLTSKDVIASSSELEPSLEKQNSVSAENSQCVNFGVAAAAKTASGSGVINTTVSASVVEILSLSMVDGKVQIMSAVGTVSLTVSPASDSELVLPFSLVDTDLISDIVCNNKYVSETDEHSYQARVPAGFESLPVLRYTLQQPGPAFFPLSVQLTCEGAGDDFVNLVVDAGHKPDTPRVTSISILVCLGGEVHSLESSSPSCLYDPDQQRICWKQIPYEARLQARLRTRGATDKVTPVSCIAQYSCASDSLSGVIVLIDPDPERRYDRADNTVQVSSRPFKIL